MSWKICEKFLILFKKICIKCANYENLSYGKKMLLDAILVIYNFIFFALLFHAINPNDIDGIIFCTWFTAMLFISTEIWAMWKLSEVEISKINKIIERLRSRTKKT